MVYASEVWFNRVYVDFTLRKLAAIAAFYRGVNTTLLKVFKFQKVIRLAVQAGVRSSTENPNPYFETNVGGTHNTFMTSVTDNEARVAYTSAASVYGESSGPFKESQVQNQHKSFYAVTKQVKEIVAQPMSTKTEFLGLSFCTVYGPWGRPDMAPLRFAFQVAENRGITLKGDGSIVRNFIYTDDMIRSISLNEYFLVFKKFTHG